MPNELFFLHCSHSKLSTLCLVTALCIGTATAAPENTLNQGEQQRLAKKLFALASDKLAKHPEAVVPDLRETKVENIGKWRIQYGPGTIAMPVLKDVEIKPRVSGDSPFFGEIEVNYTRPATRKVVTDGSPEAEKRAREIFAKPEYVHTITYVVEMVFEYRNGKWKELEQSKSNRVTSIPMGAISIQKAEDGKPPVETFQPNE